MNGNTIGSSNLILNPNTGIAVSSPNSNQTKVGPQLKAVSNNSAPLTESNNLHDSEKPDASPRSGILGCLLNKTMFTMVPLAAFAGALLFAPQIIPFLITSVILGVLLGYFLVGTLEMFS